MRMAPDQSLADIARRRWALPLVPHLITLPCPSRCTGLMVWTGRSSQQGMGPLINIHECDTCRLREDLADDHYPRIEYRTLEGRTVNIERGRVDPL
jgi:hypothetical protein